ncbi:SapC protein [Desulfurobacterium pacificum]|jgi:hypothetical protein|uniref:SapC protein n=1 Tax=Desulfurobacterium pacificum TaxID=240166 RepID=A0ABY1NEQ1_9BACT|nr:SapC family protein [Desulfurobacterium pacificum]SMP07414.1 SapC protein [Desulfurobacterium pacificum]
MLYKDVEVLNSKKHKGFKLKEVKSFEEFKPLNSCVALVSEFREACKFYPIVFMNTPEGFMPVFLLGVERNVFIDENGRWTKDYYIPAFVRRFPFILVEDKNSGNGGERKLFVGVDRRFLVKDGEGKELFNEEGKETEFLKSAARFLSAYDKDYQLTVEFASELQRLNLLQGMEATVKKGNDKTVVIKNLFVVDEVRLSKLNKEQVFDLFKKGFMGAVYAHLISLANFSKLA